jgi:hypothetical protein
MGQRRKLMNTRGVSRARPYLEDTFVLRAFGDELYTFMQIQHPRRGRDIDLRLSVLRRIEQHVAVLTSLLQQRSYPSQSDT